MPRGRIERAPSAAGFRNVGVRGLSAGGNRLSGIGKKKAERIIVELKDKISLFSTAMAGAAGKEDRPEMSDEQRMRINDAIEALISLGMKANDATKAIYGAFKEIGPDTTTTDLIKLGLKYK